MAWAEEVIDLRFVIYHGDVYVKAEGTPGHFVPVRESETNASLTKPLYTSKGTPLGFTLEQWLAARATGTYARSRYLLLSRTFQITAEKLVPNSPYTLWCASAPCGASDGSENTFVSDANGNAAYAVKVKAFSHATLIRAAYHSDGKTYGADPGIFGVNSHVQFRVFVQP